MDFESDIFIPLLVSIFSALATSYLSYRFYAPRLRIELQKEFESRYNEKKWEAYLQFSDIMFQLLDKSRTGRIDRDLPKIIRRMHEFLSKLWIIGSDDVVSAVSEWFRYSQLAEEGGEASPVGLVKLMDILIQMRKDLGYTESQIGPVELLKTFISDLDDSKLPV